MRSEDRRRLEQITERIEADLTHREERPTGSALEILRDMLRVDRIEHGWEYYDPEEIAVAANEHMERIEADLTELREQYPHARDDDHRRQMATQAQMWKNLLGLLCGVRGDAARDIGRPVTPYTGRIPLLRVDNMSPADLIALDLSRDKEHT